MIGHQVRNYRIERKIGDGSMGEVYKATNLILEREVAIKVPHPELMRDPQIQTRFLSEAKTLAKLDHPNVATIYDCFSEEREYFLVMEFIAGETLQQVIERCGTITWKKAVPLFCQVLEGIGHAHSLNIIHRDIKPSNIMLKPNNQIKVMDFGIARVLGTAKKTRTKHIVGTLEYMSPEQVEAKLELDNRTDLYSLGIVLYEMLTGNLPFSCESEYELMKAQVSQIPPAPREFNSTIPDILERVVLRALEKDRKLRFKNAEEFREALLSMSGLDIYAPTTGKLFPINSLAPEYDQVNTENEDRCFSEKREPNPTSPPPTRINTNSLSSPNKVNEDNLLIADPIKTYQATNNPVPTRINTAALSDNAYQESSKNNSINTKTTATIWNNLTWKHYTVVVIILVGVILVPFLLVGYIAGKLEKKTNETTTSSTNTSTNANSTSPVYLPQVDNTSSNSVDNSTPDDDVPLSKGKESPSKKGRPVSNSSPQDTGNEAISKEKTSTLLDIKTKPANCDVLIDNVHRGTTDSNGLGSFRASNLVIGQKYKLKVRKVGYKEYTQDILILSSRMDFPLITLSEGSSENIANNKTSPNTNVQDRSRTSPPQSFYRTPQGDTPRAEEILNAAKADDAKRITMLVRQGVDVNTRDSSGKTALIYAARSGKEKTVRTLIDLGSNVKIRDNNGKTALIHAAENGHDSTTKVLIRANSDLNTKDNSGRTALSYATSNNHKNVVRVLQSYGDRE